jgi:hypothetical protein
MSLRSKGFAEWDKVECRSFTCRFVELPGFSFVWSELYPTCHPAWLVKKRKAAIWQVKHRKAENKMNVVLNCYS